jgi:Zn-dependent protease
MATIQPDETTRTEDMPAEKPKSLRFLTALMVMTKLSKLAKVAKTTKVLQPLITFGTMIVSVFAYSFALGLPFAIGFVLMIFIHEAGHAIALRRKGIKASMPIFIPFLGAAIFAPSFGNRHTEAYMAFAGPLIGTLGALGLFTFAVIIPGSHPLLLAIAFTALIINLFNLIPISPLDGGRITQAVGPAFKYVGVAALLALTLMLQTPGLLLVWVLVLNDARMRAGLRLFLGITLMTMAVTMMLTGIGEPQPFWVNIVDVVLMTIFNVLFFLRWHKWDKELAPPDDDRPQLDARTRLQWFIAYAILTAFLVIMAVVTHAKLEIFIAA